MRRADGLVWATRLSAGGAAAGLLLTGEPTTAVPLAALAYLAGFFRGRPVGGWVCLAAGLPAVVCGLGLVWDRLRPPPPPLDGLDLYGAAMGDVLLTGGVWLGAGLAVAAGFVATAVFDPPLTPSACGTARTGTSSRAAPPPPPGGTGR